MTNLDLLKEKMEQVALAAKGYLPFDVLSALREPDWNSFKVNLWRQYERTNSWLAIDEFWEAACGSCFEELRPAALVASFRPFDANDIKLIRLANRDTLDSTVRNIVDALASCLEENLPLPVKKLRTYKRDIVEILIDAAGDGNTILAEELYDCVLGLRQLNKNSIWWPAAATLGAGS